MLFEQGFWFSDSESSDSYSTVDLDEQVHKDYITGFLEVKPNGI